MATNHEVRGSNPLRCNLTPHCLMIESTALGPIETNGIILFCPKTKQAALIDAPFGALEHFKKRIKELDLNVVMILLTHSHWDHIAEAAELKKHFNVPVLIHSEDASSLSKPGSDNMRSFDKIEGVDPDQLLSDGQIVELGNLKIEVIHTPGHAPGSVCFYIPSEKLLISGDTLFCRSIGRLDLPTSQAERMWPSLKKLAKLPPDIRVYPGHGEPTTIGDETFLNNAEEFFG